MFFLKEFLIQLVKLSLNEHNKPQPHGLQQNGESYKMKKGKLLFLDFGPLQKPVGTDLEKEQI